MKQEQIDSLRRAVIAPQSHIIGGKTTPSVSGRTLTVISPIDGKAFTSIAEGSAEEVNLAVAAARAAFDKGVWRNAAPAERKKRLLKLAELIEANALEIAVLGSRDNGTEISMALKAEPLSAATTFRYYAEAIDKIYGEIAPTAPDVLALIHREPLGVVGIIVPWNFPLMIGAWKIAPALAAGNSVVVKPAEIASLSLLRIAGLALEAGIPEGVFNVVTGKGSVVGEALGLHMDVDALGFTGSGAIGRRLLEYSARSNIKRVFLELGGKSPNIVFADAPNLDQAAKATAFGIFRNAGQVCIAGSRLLIEESVHDEFLEKVVACTRKLKSGDPLDVTTEIGAVASADQLGKNLQFVANATREGGKLLLGGARIREETGGFYQSPAIFADVVPTMEIAREEVFGPVLAVMRFKDEAGAVQLANNTVYGLASGVWTANLARAHRMVRAIRAGVVHVNCYGGADITVPLGGFGQSGFGRDKSLHAMEKFSDLKTAWMSLS